MPTCLAPPRAEGCLCFLGVKLEEFSAWISLPRVSAKGNLPTEAPGPSRRAHTQDGEADLGGEEGVCSPPVGRTFTYPTYALLTTTALLPSFYR